MGRGKEKGEGEEKEAEAWVYTMKLMTGREEGREGRDARDICVYIYTGESPLFHDCGAQTCARSPLFLLRHPLCPARSHRRRRQRRPLKLPTREPTRDASCPNFVPAGEEGREEIISPVVRTIYGGAEGEEGFPGLFQLTRLLPEYINI